jgi:hypothetical protein
VSLQQEQLAELTALVTPPGAGPAWVRELALHAVLIAVCHQKVADAPTREETKDCIADLAEAVKQCKQKALQHAEYQARLAALVKNATNGNARKEAQG